jgi:lysophospholipase L1-like esterase
VRRWRAVGARLLLVLGLALPRLGAPAEAITLPALPSDGTILAFGDSLTAGIGGSGESYPRRLAQLIGHEVIDAGVPGDTTADGPTRLVASLREQRPALLILCLGVNDFLRGVPRERVQANLRALLALADEAGVPVLLLAVPAPGGREADPLFVALARPGRVRVDEHAMADALLNPALKADLVHPNGEGYRQIATAVARSLRASGALP